MRIAFMNFSELIVGKKEEDDSDADEVESLPRGRFRPKPGNQNGSCSNKRQLH